MTETDSSTMAVSSSSVIKLEGERNWSVWKFQITVTLNPLKGAELFSVVDGSLEKPDDTAEKKTETAAWIKKDIKAQSVIVSRLSEEAMIHVLTCETAADMWAKLHSVFEAKSATSTLMLQQKFLQSKYEGGELSVYLAKVQEMACKLKQAGETVSDKFIMTKVLMALPDEYSHFVTAWESVDTDKQNFNDMVARLLVEEERVKAKKPASDTENMAMFVRKGGFVRRCNKCNAPGHLAKDCRS
ncbi:gag-polypeptide of LTR copia-type domain-containing protein [Phthorimaea operculella]|nr:gag-polypeptide of LTR copia-type domain-containing protein [Phthorimaea operculella]